MTDTPPAIYHFTQWKAGSQWVQGVLTELEPNRIYVPPMPVADGLVFEAVVPGRIYSPLYMNRQRFDESPFPHAPHRRFVVIRDLRDTLISWYFSLAKTHDENPDVLRHRAILRDMDVETGLLYLVEHQDFFGLTTIGSTWHEAADTLVIRFEDLIENPIRGFRLICEECELDPTPEQFRKALKWRSFEALAGRKRGSEGDSHYRRGVAGDWERHFTPRVREAFSARFDDLQARIGYSPAMV
jgi:lipopolysaccharide transport system ATP-binding protein